MTPAAPHQLRTLSFGSADGTLWAAALDGAPGALIAGDAAEARTATALDPAVWSIDERVWRLTADGIELTVEPVGEAASEDGADGASAYQEQCRVRGTLGLGGASRAVDAFGVRSVLTGFDLSALGSLRAVSGWFGDGDGFTLVALRPKRSSHHESDLVAATLFDPGEWIPVGDPRLSTTYDAAGVPTKVNLELWIGEGESEFPRRVAGEAIGGAVRVGGVGGEGGDGGEVSVVPLQCHSRGQDGFGAYLLAAL